MFQHIQNIFTKNNIKIIILTPNVESKIFWEKMGLIDSGKIDPSNELPIYIKEI
jgi:hypothetical protein